MLRNLRSGQLARPTRESVRLQNCRWQRPHHSNVTITTTSRRRCWRTIQNFRVPNCWCRRTIPFSYKSAVLLRNIFHRQCDAYFIASEFLMKGPVTTFSDPLSLSNDVTKLHSDSSIDLLLSLWYIGLHLEIALNKIDTMACLRNVVFGLKEQSESCLEDFTIQVAEGKVILPGNNYLHYISRLKIADRNANPVDQIRIDTLEELGRFDEPV